MGEGLFAEHLLLFEHTRLGKALSCLGQYQVALLGICQVKHIGRLHQWEQIIEFQVQVAPKLVQVFASSSCMNQFDEARHIADGDMWQYLVGARRWWL